MSEYEITTKEVPLMRVAILPAIIESYAKVGRLFKELRQTLAEEGISPSGPQLAIYLDEEYTPHNAAVAAAVPVKVPLGTKMPEDIRVQFDDLPGDLMVSLPFNNKEILEKKLADFGVEVRVAAVHPGPVITLFEIELAAAG